MLDLVPQTLAKLGVREVFHKVRLKPGKPLWFGVASKTASPTLVFGLPGNPVSGLVCFELFVRPTLRKLQGSLTPGVHTTTALLLANHQVKGDRETYLPGKLQRHADQCQVQPIDWQGSADQRSLGQANCLIQFPARTTPYEMGEQVEVVELFQDL